MYNTSNVDILHMFAIFVDLPILYIFYMFTLYITLGYLHSVDYFCFYKHVVSLITLLPKSLFHIIELSILFSTAEASAHADKVPKSAAN